MPSVPWSRTERTMTFFGANKAMPVFLALLMGLQHAFAMLGGLITPPLVVMKFSVDGFPFARTDLHEYAIAASLIVSGLCTIVNCVQIPLPGGFKLGTGVLSVVGTSFTFLPVFQAAIGQMKADGDSGMDAYGRMLGTVMVCAFLEIFLSFIPPLQLKKAFPPIVSGITVMLIGVSLTGTGMKYWGGGAVCADMAWKQHGQLADAAFSPVPSPMCASGETSLGFGSAQLVGLGFSVMCMLVIIELFGSPFMKNCNVVIALLFGYFVAGVSRHCYDTTNDDGEVIEVCDRYVTSANIDSAEDITFLWVKNFKLGFYGPAVFPLLICFVVTTVESIGDIRATYESSSLELDTENYGKSIQGGLLSDGICSFFSAIATSMPNTTFSQNNGVIALTKCASRHAGIACGGWLIFMGIIAKISGVISSIPSAVLGGMTTFLVCNVFVSGLRVVSSADLESRRNRFILAVAMGVGMGVAIVPYMFGDFRASAFTANFWPCTDCSKAEKAWRSGVLIFLNTPYCIGTFLAMFLNLILPKDPKIIADDKDEDLGKPVAAEKVVEARA
eukprot:PRCOL_00006898-RA